MLKVQLARMTEEFHDVHSRSLAQVELLLLPLEERGP